MSARTAGRDRKPALTFEQRVQVVFGHYYLGISQHDLAAMFGVNAGRVAEACTAVRDALASKRPEGEA